MEKLGLLPEILSRFVGCEGYIDDVRKLVTGLVKVSNYQLLTDNYDVSDNQILSGAIRVYLSEVKSQRVERCLES